MGHILDGWYGCVLDRSDSKGIRVSHLHSRVSQYGYNYWQHCTTAYEHSKIHSHCSVFMQMCSPPGDVCQARLAAPMLYCGSNYDMMYGCNESACNANYDLLPGNQTEGGESCSISTSKAIIHLSVLRCLSMPSLSAKTMLGFCC